MLQKLQHTLHLNEIPSNIQILSYAIGIRWFGWGFAESLIPVLIFSYSSNFAHTGIFSSTANIVGLLVLPYIGVFADKVRATSLIAFGVIFYIGIGTGYFLFGVTGSLFFLLFALMMQGIAPAIDKIGRTTYIQKHSEKNKIATMFGFIDTIANLWWIVAGLLGIILLHYFSITQLLFLVAPTSVIYALIILKLRRNEKVIATNTHHLFSVNPFKEVASWNLSLKSLLLFNFTVAFAGTIILIFLPLDVYQGDGSLWQVMTIGIIGALPGLAGWKLGRFFDARGYKVIGSALLIFALVLLLVSFFTNFYVRLVAMLIIGTILELLAIGSTEIMTSSALSSHLGRINGVMQGSNTIGAILGSIIGGFLIQSTNMASTLVSLAMLIFAIAIIFKALDKKGVWMFSGYRNR